MNRFAPLATAAPLYEQPASIEFRYAPDILPFVVRVTDLVSIVAATVAIFGFWGPPEASAGRLIPTFAAVSAIAFLLLARTSDFYNLPAVMAPLQRLDGLLVVVGGAFVLTFALSVMFGAARPGDWARFAGAGAGAFVALAVCRIVTSRLLRRLEGRGVFGRSIVILGVGDQARRFLRRYDAVQPHFAHVAGVFDPSGQAVGAQFHGHVVLGDIESLVQYARQRKINDVVIAMPWTADLQVAEAIEALKELPVNVHLSTDLVGYEPVLSPAPGNLSSCALFEVVKRPISGWSSGLKAAFDYVAAAIGLALLLPLFGFVALAIKLDSPGPVFFKQTRLGFNNKPFGIYKFRTMWHQPGQQHEVRQATRNDPRVTRVGAVLRATSLDELPQLLNVLNGTMSLVGPRPHALSHNEEYGRIIRGYSARHRVKPGITGWAQVNGFRGETADVQMMKNRVDHDIYYTENWSFLFDMKILAMTIVVFLFQRNAY